jgi:hypothetical protein
MESAGSIKMNNTTQIFEFSYNQPLFVMELNVYLLILLIIGVAVVCFGVLYLLIKKHKKNFELVQLEFDSKGPRLTYNIERNYENLEIAHRIYTELITRKAAIPIDYENDVITEIYDSWYILFKVTRDEIKTLSGKSLQDKKKSDELIKMATDILNKGLRPHLTLYQAKFRKWYGEELAEKDNKGKSPQEIQKQFPEYNELITSMENVNHILIEYSEQLHNFITGEN